jgi:arylsulfatase A-like enzyme
MKRFPACLISLVVSAAGAASPGSPTLPPDILILMPDQMRGDTMSAVGHPVVRTPQLDALAAQGTLFRRAYSTVPSCIPARFALLTGQQAQTSGVVGYAMRPITVPTLPAVLAAAGYATALVGRNMHQSPESGTLGYARQILASTYVPDDDYDQELKRALPAIGGIRGVVATLRLDNNRWPAAPWPHAEEWHPTAWIVRRSREVIAATPPGQPLFLTTSFYAPHPPLFPPARLFEKHLAATLPPAAMGAWVDRARLRPEGDKAGARVLLAGETLRRAQAGYFGLIEHLDEQIAGLVADFCTRSEKAGRAWVILVTSDHGEMLGDHGYFRKCEPYEGSGNIPFIVAASPRLGLQRGAVSTQPVGLEDVMPTLLDLAGVTPPASVDGRSLVPALRGAREPGREWLHFEHAPTYSEEQGFHALVDGRLKYIWRPKTGREQLFDLVADPREEDDLAARPTHAATLASWRERLVRRLAGRPEGFSEGGRLIAGRPYPRIQKKPPPPKS